MANVTPPDAATFKAQYPEFGTLSDALCDEFLADAALEFDAELFPTRRGSSACMLAAARAIALSPAGREMQLVAKDGSTVYDERIRKAKSRATMLLR